MTGRERILAAISGRPIDRVPYSVWYHFRLTPPAGENMAQAELAFFRRLRPDLLKVMHDIPYEMPAGLPQVEVVDDWMRMPVLDGKTGNFGAQLKTVQMIKAGLDEDVPVIDTVFNVFSIAQKACGRRVMGFLGTDPEKTHIGLRNIAHSLANYARQLTQSGADGIYLAIAGAALDSMPAEEYRRHFLAYDQQVLDAACEAVVNVAHHHGKGIYPELVLSLKGYHIYSWSSRLAGNPDLREMRLKTQICLMSGVDETSFAVCSPEAIQAQAKEAISVTNGRGFILAPGCAVPTPPESPEENLLALRNAAVAG
jgi:uroporphyrinogen decarboxylase